MIIHRDIIQNSPEWYKIRCGKLTASNFGRIITGEGRMASTAWEVENDVVGEILTGDPVSDEEGFGGKLWAERGKMLEPKARALYEIATGEAVEVVGFVENDEGTIGCSPDGLVGTAGLVQIKCLKPKHHIGIFRKQQNDEIYKIEKKYFAQFQGELLVTGRKWVDAWFYHPKIKPFRRRYERDIIYIAKLEAILNTMVKNIKEAVQQMREENQ